MATILPRIQVTPTPELQAAIEGELARRPGMSRSEVVLGFALRGIARTADDAAERRAARRRALEETRGMIDYPPGYLAELRRDSDRGEAAT